MACVLTRWASSFSEVDFLKYVCYNTDVGHELPLGFEP